MTTPDHPRPRPSARLRSLPAALDGPLPLVRPREGLVAVTGATGYIGGRLAPRLLDQGYRVRCLVRDPRKLDARPWISHPRLEVVTVDLGDVARVARALQGCTAAYYLVHSMRSAGPAYADEDRRLASAFAAAAERAGVGRILYLGGLGETGDGLSDHLRSRREVEQVLRGVRVPVTVFRAAMIIGSGSASFEILRYLVERLPVMVTPRWVSTECQPIAVDDVLHYLTASLETPETEGLTLDIGGPDVATYRELMQIMAEERGLRKRLIVPVPLLTPRLSSLWIHLVTPVGHRLARPLAEGLRNRVVCRDNQAGTLMPLAKPLGIREAIRTSFGRMQHDAVETAWTDAGVVPGDPDWAGGTVFVDRRTVRIEASPPAVFQAVGRVGGGHGYYAADWLWRLRGRLDRLVGGPGLRRGRRRREEIGYGDALDFWRVTGVEKHRRLDLRAEMKLPGEALLSFEIRPAIDGRSELVQTARFKPRGLGGLAYWAAVLPLHGFVFRGMLRGIRRAAEQIQRDRNRHTHPDRERAARHRASGAIHEPRNDP